MNIPIGWRVTAAVWIANVAVTALAVGALEHPKPYVPAADVWQPTETRYKLAEDNKAELGEPAGTAIEMPMVTIEPNEASEHGRALMQGTPDVVIGPGTVTHPSTIPPQPGH